MSQKDIKQLTKANDNFRKVLYTGQHCQMVAMSIPVGEEIGEEVHPETDQIFFIVEGKAEVTINGEGRYVEKHDIVFISAGQKHNVANRDDENLKLCTIYAPPHHPADTVHQTKHDAQLQETQQTQI